MEFDFTTTTAGFHTETPRSPTCQGAVFPLKPTRISKPLATAPRRWAPCQSKSLPLSSHHRHGRLESAAGLKSSPVKSRPTQTSRAPLRRARQGWLGWEGGGSGPSAAPAAWGETAAQRMRLAPLPDGPCSRRHPRMLPAPPSRSLPRGSHRDTTVPREAPSLAQTETGSTSRHGNRAAQLPARGAEQPPAEGSRAGAGSRRTAAAAGSRGPCAFPSPWDL